MEEGKKRVLVVDDEPDALEFVRAVMEEAGCHVVTAGSHDECMERLQQAAPDLVVLDIQMPGRPGFFTLQEIRKDAATSSVPVIMLSGAGERLGIEVSKKAMYDYLGQEPDAYLEKPINPDRLRDVALKLLG